MLVVSKEPGTLRALPLYLVCPLRPQKKLTVFENSRPENINLSWVLKGFNSNLRYTTRPEKEILDKEPSILNKPENTFGAMIPLKKSEAWWLMTQEERRKIFEEDSMHIRIGANYLSTVSRKLYHSRDIGEHFDFITWFEFKPENANLFDELLDALRKTEEWKYVIGEIDIRIKK